MSQAVRNLRAVPPPDEPPIDITLALRADIHARDWNAAMIWGDRQKPVILPGLDRVWRLFRG